MDEPTLQAVPAAEPGDRTPPASDSKHRKVADLIGISGVSLFFEMALIRFIGSTVQIIAYFNNFVILSAFLGLGFGALLSRRHRGLFGVFPLVLVAFVAGLVFLDRFASAADDQHDLVAWRSGARLQFPTVVVVAGIFLGCFAVFVPLGAKLGRALEGFDDRLEAYGYDLVGSICGVIAFTLLSWLGQPPVVWFGVGCVVIAVLLGAERAAMFWRLPVLAGVVALSWMPVPGLYSPYYKIQSQAFFRPGGQKPVVFSVIVDKLRIQDAIDFDQQLDDTPLAGWVPYYQLPYRLRLPSRVLVLGGGSGNDTAMALRAGAQAVDVVEVDPVLVGFGRELHPQRPYADPRVHAINDDARAFLRRTNDAYDAIVMNALDSHHQPPGLSTLRLESFIYTVEAFRDVQRHMLPDSLFVVQLSSTRPWMAQRLFASLTEAFGREPTLLTTLGTPSGSIAFAIGPASVLGGTRPSECGLLVLPPDRLRASRAHTALATDDWPHLYLASPRIPTLYCQVLAIIVIATLVIFGGAGGARFNRGNLHFALLGAGFMLLETRAITQFALLFGTTWLVNAIVITSVLCVVYLGNHLVAKGRTPRPSAVFPALFASLLLLYVLPLDLLLPWNHALRILGAGVVIGVPVFLASVAFSSSFRDAPDTAQAFGANLIGVVLGGALEYSSMVFGLRVLYLVALVIYAAAFWAARARAAHAGALLQPGAAAPGG